jgi:hypothetical protein
MQQDLLAGMGISIVGAVLLIVCLFPPFIPVVFVAGAVAVVVSRMFVRVIVPYSRLELQAYGPLASLVGDIIAGGAVMRTNGRQNAFLSRAGVMVEEIGAANLAAYALYRWYSYTKCTTCNIY